MLTLKEWCKVSEKRGPYKVTRWCCNSGCCDKCRGGAKAANRVRVVQMESLNREAAEIVMDGWAGYGAEIEKS